MLSWRGLESVALAPESSKWKPVPEMIPTNDRAMLTWTVHVLADVFPNSSKTSKYSQIPCLPWMSVSVCSGFRLLIDLVPWEQKHWKSSWLMTGHSLQRRHQAGPPRSMSSWACGNPNSKALTSHSILARSQGSLGSPVVLSHPASYSVCPETLLRTNCFAVFRCPVYNQNIRRRQGWCAIRLRTAAM